MNEDNSNVKKVFIEYREYCAYPDAKIGDLLTKYGIDPKKPHTIIYNQALRRYEIEQDLSSNEQTG